MGNSKFSTSLYKTSKKRIKPSKFSGDIITDNGLGVAASDMIEHLFEIQPEAKYFFHFVREWFSQQGLNFKTYTLAMLVIFFFQSENLMPSVERVQRNVEPVYIDGKN